MKQLLNFLLVLVFAFSLWLVPTGSIVIAQEPVEVVSLRTATSKTFLLGNGTYELISSGNLHYQSSNGTWENINNEIVPAQAPWNYQMTKDFYTARFLSSFTAGQVIKWEAYNQSVAFQPMELQWTNDLNQISSISMPQNTAVLVTNTSMQLLEGVETGYYQGTIRWNNAYGTDRNFWWTCDTGRLVKVLELATNNLPIPPDYIISGGNPVLRLNFIFAPSAGLYIYTDGILWDKSTTIKTFNIVEFRNASNQTLWYFDPALVTDTGGNSTVGVSELRKAGNNLYVSIRVPYNWLQSAVYPVYIDPSVEKGASKDNWLDSEVHTTNHGIETTMSVGTYLGAESLFGRGVVEFTVSWGTDVPTCAYLEDTSKLELYATAQTGSPTVTATRLLRTDWHETQSCWDNYKTGTAWSSHGAGGSGTDYSDTYSIPVTISSTGLKSWTGSSMKNLIGASRTAGHNVMFRLKGSSESTSTIYASLATKEHGTASYRPKLTIVYTLVSAPSIHTDAATNVLTTTATINGEITATGGENPTVTMYWGNEDGGSTPASWDFNGAPTSPSQPQGVAAFYKDVTSLSPSTLYYFNAKATNCYATTWATTKSFTTASACSPETTTSPSTWNVNGGTPVTISTNYTTGLTFFNTTNNSGGAVTIRIAGLDMIGGNAWDLDDDGNINNMVYAMRAGLEGGDYTIIVRETADFNILKAGLADGASQLWGLKLSTPTVYSDGVTKTGNITLTVTCD